MPSGARRRKAVRKKKKHKRVAHNSSNTNSDSISSTHSQESDDVKSVDERESDSGEAVRDEKGKAVGEDESRSSKGEGPEQETVEVARELKLQEGNLMAGSDSSGVGVAKKAQNGVDSMPRNGGSEEKEITVEPEENREIAQSVQDSGSIFKEGFKVGTTDTADYLSEETVGAKGAVAVQVYNLLGEQVPHTESIKEVVTSPQESYLAPQTDVGKSSAQSELVKTDWKSNIEVPPLSDERENSPAAAVESHLKKIEAKAVPVEDDKQNKTFSYEKENADKFSEDLSVPAVNASSGLEAAITPAIETTRDVVCVKTRGTADNQVSASVVETSHGVDNGEEFEYSKHSEDQPLIGSTSIPVQRTSWKSCCGIFEVCSRSR